MPESLLRTKFFMPRLGPKSVERAHLLARLDEGIASARRMTLVVAPVGYGKTTIIADWLGRTSSATAWLSLESDDNDLVRFWTYFVAALQQAQPGLGQKARTLLRAAPNPSIPNILADLINELSAAPSGIILVLDDYHLIQSTEVHQGLNFLLDHLPPRLHLVIITREDPPLPLAQLRARGQMLELRAKDLRFSLRETTQLLTEAMGLPLSKPQVMALEQRTEGWIAGLQMAALSLRDVDDLEAFISTFAGDHRYVADYLLTEVLNRQQPRVREFLTSTAVVDRFTPDLCEALAGAPGNSSAVIEELEALGLFLIPLDHKRQWFRYHQLFADLLRLRLQQEQPERYAELNRRASQWYESQGLTDEAIKHRLAAGEPDETARLIEAAGLGMIGRSRLGILQAWIAALPKDTVRRRPYLSLLLAWIGFLTGQPELAAENLRLAQQPPDGGYDSPPDFACQVELLHAYAARISGDLDAAIEHTLEARRYPVVQQPFLACALALNLGGNYWLRGDFAALEQPLRQAVSFAGDPAAEYPGLAAAGFLANAYFQRGQLNSAAALCTGLLEVPSRVDSPAAAYVYLEQGELQYERNELEKALESLTRAIELGESADRIVNVIRARQVLARVHHALGNQEEVDDLTAQAAELFERYSPRFQLMRRIEYEHYRIGGLLMQNSLESVLHWADAYAGSRDLLNSNWALLMDLLYARALLLQGKVAEATDMAGACAHAAKGLGTGTWLLRSMLVQSLCQQEAGSLAEATSSLRTCLGLAEPEGFIRTFVDHGAGMAKLLRSAASAVASPYSERLLVAFARPDDGVGSGPSGPLVESLTVQETSILRLMNAGLSHGEIARERFLSLNTVKWHTAHIYRKLSVHRRAHAVARARELGIL